MYLYFAYFPIVLAILSIPGIIIYVLILILTGTTTWRVVTSGDGTQLEPLETNSCINIFKVIVKGFSVHTAILNNFAYRNF